MIKIKFQNQNIDCLNFNNGKWTSGTGPRIPVISPYSGAQIGTLVSSSKEDVNAVLENAQKAALVWGKTPLKERTQILFEWRNELLKNADEISHSISSECGKTWTEARAELAKGIEVLEFALSLQNLDSGAKLEVSRGVSCEYRREPLGVVVGITPFNFPSMVPMWMIPIALALGNSFVWKPSEKTPLTSLWLANTAQAAGLPHGVFSVVQGSRETVELLIDHPHTKAIGFVGSSFVAKEVYKRGSLLGKRVLALGGAKNHIILMPDADPEIATKSIVESYTACAGQRCMAASVLLMVGESKKLLPEIIKKSSEVVLGETMGALISQESKTKLHSAIDKALQEGAQLVLDGRSPKVSKEYEKGFWLGPTILSQVKPNSEAACSELFGPVLSVMECATLSDALEIESQSLYGNAASIFTSSGMAAQKLVESTKAGMVGINVGVPVPREPFSFGGTGQSKFGQGDITGEGSLDFWSDLKKITTRWFPSNDKNWMS